LAALVTAGLLAGLAACSSTTAGHGGKTSVPATGPAAQAVASTWVPSTDAETGIRFELPAGAEKSLQPMSSGGQSLVRSSYQIQLDLFVQLSVTIDSGDGKPVRFGDPGTVLTGLVTQVQADRDNDSVRVLDRKPLTVLGRPALDFGITYTVKPPKKGPAVLLARSVQAPAAMVTLQTFSSLLEAVPLATLRALQARLVASLKLV
jgi:hypothetical protein